MLPSTSGGPLVRVASGDASSGNQGVRRSKVRYQSSAAPRNTQGFQPSSNHIFVTVTPSSLPVNANNNTDRPYSYPAASHQPPTSSASTMIGPTSIVYQQEYSNAHNGADDGLQYQQWIDSFTTQQQQQLGVLSVSNHGNLPNEGEQHYQFTFDTRSYPTTHSSEPYIFGAAHSISNGVEHGSQLDQQPHHINDSYISFYSDGHTSAAPNSLAPDTTFQQTTFAPDGYPVAEPTGHQQVAMYHQGHVQRPSSQLDAMLPYTSETIGSTGSDAGSSQIGRNSASLSPPSSSLSPMSANFRVNVAEQGTHHRAERLEANTDSSPGPDANPRNATESRAQSTVSPQKTPAKKMVRPSATSPPKRKRRKKTPGRNVAFLGTTLSESESEEDFEAENGGISVGVDGLGDVGRPGKALGGLRTPGACANCKRLKMKCEFPKGEKTCKRCKSGGHICIVEPRKPKIPANKREYLLAQLRQKDAVIESLLKQLHNPYQATPMSIESYLMATSPSDRDNRDTIEWLTRLKSSLKTGDGKLNAFMDPRPEQPADEESEPDDSTVYAQIGQSSASGGEDAEDDGHDEKLSSLHVPLDLLADLSLDVVKRKRPGKRGNMKESLLKRHDPDDTNIGVANETFFMPGPATDLDARAMLIEQHSPPEIVLHGLVTPEDVDRLFEIFYEHINPFISLLDPVLHTPASTFARCPFLFTVVCAISSRYYTKKAGIYPIAMHFAKHSAANALVDGWKSVELCQAYILMSIYAVPARRWEEDRSWLYTGLAIRLATDLNLHQPSSSKPLSEKQEREILNKTRVWMVCCNLDRSTATQFGKPSTIKEHYILRHAKDWYKISKYNHPYDIHLCAYSVLLQIVARFHEEIFSDPSSPTGLNKSVDFRSVTFAHDERLTQFQDEWTKKFLNDSDRSDRACAFRCSLLPYLVGYSRLVMFSFGFQQAYRRGLKPEDHIFFTKCLTAAKLVVIDMIEGLVSSGYMRYAPDGHFIFASFASAFLLKLLRPEFSSLLTKDEEMDILVLISRLIQTLSSSKLAIDDKHMPKLYARFLAGLLARHRREGIANGHLSASSHNPRPPPEGRSETVHDYSENVIAAAAQAQEQTGNVSNFDNSDRHAEINMYETGPISDDTSIPIIIDDEYLLEGNILPEEEFLATMQTIKNPTFWQNMMLPGFSWPEQSPSPSSQGVTPPPYGVFDNTRNTNQSNYQYML